MFKKNQEYLQDTFFKQLPSEADQIFKDAGESEYGKIYELVFCKIDEELFKALYCNDNGRPNAPINSLVTALIIKHKKNWTYADLFENLQYNIAFRYSIGLTDFTSKPFNQATLFNFINRIKEYSEKTNENLFEKVFDELTKQQLESLKLKTNIARTDSVMINSNIRSYGLLQLLIETALRLYRILDEKDKEKFCLKFKKYTQQTSEKYIYNLRGSDLSHEITEVCSMYNWLRLNLFRDYHVSEEYKLFLKAYSDFFEIDSQDKLKIKESNKIKSGALQSPDDKDASYRKKRGKKNRGYVANITETANPENPINLVVDVAVATNNTDDSKILNERIDNVKEKLPDLEELHADGGYASTDNDKKLEASEIMMVQTAIRGRKNDFEPKVIDDKEEVKSICHNGQEVVCTLTPGKRYKASFDRKICKDCSYQRKCPTQKQKKSRAFYFDSEYITKKRRQGNILKIPEERRKIRPNVEASIKEFSCRTDSHKLRVRGLFKAQFFAYATAIAVNFGRIYRLLEAGPDGSIFSLFQASQVSFKRIRNLFFTRIGNIFFPDKVSKATPICLGLKLFFLKLSF